MKQSITNALIGLTLIAQSLVLRAESLEDLKLKTDLSAITKLEDTLSKVSKESRVLVELRLADLYAEVARRTFQSEIEQKKNHNSSNQQRRQAIRYYKGVLKRVKSDETNFETQMKLASLYAELREYKLAHSTLNAVISHPKTPSSIRLVATEHRGHAYFSAGEYKLAEKDYKAVLNSKNNTQMNLSLIYYRLAWAQVQLQKVALAKLNYQKAIEIIAKNNHKEGLDVYLDYATLLIQDKTSDIHEINSILMKAHSDFKNRLTTDIANEAFRLARYDLALPLYDQIRKDPSHEEHTQILAKLRLVLIQSKTQGDQASLDSFREVVKESKSCTKSEDKCKMIQSEIRSFALQVHKIKKARPDQIVLETYKSYLEAYPEEAALFVTASGVASYLDKHLDARQLFESGILLEQDKNLKEDYLISNLSRAEATQDATDKRLTYLFYLDHGNNPTLKAQVDLEIAKIDFKNQNYEAAFNRSYQLSKNKNAPSNTADAASEIAIQGLIKQNKDEEILKVATEFSKQFDSKRSYFEGIAKQAQISILIAATQEPKKLSERELTNNFNQIKNLAEREHNELEKKLLIKNLIRIASEAENSKLKIEALVFFLSLRNITSNEASEATAKLYQSYLKEFEFNKAFQLAKANQALLLISDIEIAQLADISRNYTQASKLYEKVLKTSSLSKLEKSATVTRLLQLSDNPGIVLRKHLSTLRLDRNNFDQTLSALYIIEPSLRTKIDSLAKTVRTPRLQLAQSRVKGLEFLKALKFNDPIKLTLTHSRNSLNTYQNYLRQLDQTLIRANKIQHTGSQIVTLRAISVFNKKFVEDLSALSIPKEVSKEMETVYLEQIKTLSKPYLEKSILAKQKAEKLEAALEESLKAERRVARFELTGFLNEEAKLFEKKISAFSGDFNASDLKQISQTRHSDWKDQQSGIRNQIGENFYSLETQFGNPVLALFLTTRKNDKKSGARL